MFIGLFLYIWLMSESLIYNIICKNTTSDSDMIEDLIYHGLLQGVESRQTSSFGG